MRGKQLLKLLKGHNQVYKDALRMTFVPSVLCKLQSAGIIRQDRELQCCDLKE